MPLYLYSCIQNSPRLQSTVQSTISLLVRYVMIHLPNLIIGHCIAYEISRSTATPNHTKMPPQIVKMTKTTSSIMFQSLGKVHSASKKRKIWLKPRTKKVFILTKNLPFLPEKNWSLQPRPSVALSCQKTESSIPPFIAINPIPANCHPIQFKLPSYPILPSTDMAHQGIAFKPTLRIRLGPSKRVNLAKSTVVSSLVQDEFSSPLISSSME